MGQQIRAWSLQLFQQYLSLTPSKASRLWALEHLIWMDGWQALASPLFRVLHVCFAL